MRNAHPRYMCYPSVVRAGCETEVTVFPRDLSRVFRPEREYELSVLALDDDSVSYREPLKMDHPFEISGGCMKFRHFFDREQEYSVRLRQKGGADTTIAMYAVADDLFELRPLKGDLHTHSYYSDGQDGIPMTPADYREEGFDFFALTDHNRFFPSVMVNELYADVPLGMHMMTGEEVHTPGSTLHLVHAGGKHSVAEKYIHDPEKYEAEVDAIEAELTHIPEHYRRKAALAKWACDGIHAAGGIAIYAHPHWRPRQSGLQMNYNVSHEFSEILFGMGILDAFELIGGIDSRLCNMQLALWQEQVLKGNRVSVVGSSDSHEHDFENRYFARRFSIVFAKENTTEAILDAVRAGYSVACELPASSGSDVRIFGDLRLVCFAHFLFDNYFNETWRLCIGEGILMRRFAEGEDVAAQLIACKDTVENHYKKFYGISPAPAITAERAAFLDKCLELQRAKGPTTMGSSIEPGRNNRRE